MRTDTKGKDFQDRAEHWAELQEHAHLGEVSQDETRAPYEPIIFDPLSGGPWPVDAMPADIRKAERNLYPLWYTLVCGAALGLLALVVSWWIPGS